MSFAEVFTMSFFVLFGLAMLISSIGFYKFIYFISLGYGFSIAAIGVFAIRLLLLITFIIISHFFHFGNNL